MENDAPRLYALVRADLASMNAGKAIAQGMHAANALEDAIRRLAGKSERDDVEPPFPATPAQIARKETILAEFGAWKRQTRQGFGTTITLGVVIQDGKTAPLGIDVIRSTIEAARNAGFPAEVIHDPTYPLVDGSVLHLIPLDTCAYAFGTEEALRPLLARFGLHP
jgi:hypothetical protein